MILSHSATGAAPQEATAALEAGSQVAARCCECSHRVRRILEPKWLWSSKCVYVWGSKRRSGRGASVGQMPKACNCESGALAEDGSWCRGCEGRPRSTAANRAQHPTAHASTAASPANPLPRRRTPALARPPLPALPLLPVLPCLCLQVNSAGDPVEATSAELARNVAQESCVMADFG